MVEEAYKAARQCLSTSFSPELERDSVHVHLHSLCDESESSDIGSFAKLLSPDEIERSSKFICRSTRIQWILSRAKLRLTLAHYLQQDAEQIEFGQSDLGKPYIATPQSSGLYFNLSHTEGSLSIAVTRIGEIGTDIEQVREMSDIDQLVERFFSTSEVATYQDLPNEHRTEAFWTAWTRKEAFLKARGTGLSTPLDEFDVSLAPEATQALLNIRIQGESTSDWLIQSFRASHRYLGAIALKKPFAQVELFNHETPTPHLSNN